MNETSGDLTPAVGAYLNGLDLGEAQLELLIRYCRQWIDAPAWSGDLAPLRAKLDEVKTSDDLHAWTQEALAVGIDPW